MTHSCIRDFNTVLLNSSQTINLFRPATTFIDIKSSPASVNLEELIFPGV